MRLRRASLVMLSVILVFVLAACGGGNNAANSGKNTSTEKPTSAATNAPAEETAAPDDGALDHSKPLKLTVFSTTANYLRSTDRMVLQKSSRISSTSKWTL